MGRSPSHTIKKVKRPNSLHSSVKVSKLSKGQTIKLFTVPNNDTMTDTSSPNNDTMTDTSSPNNHTMPPVLFRCVSTYGQETSSTNDTLIVDNINFDTDFNEHGIRCIVLRNPDISIENHMYAWCVTTDGYLREIEHYGIIGKVLDVEIMN
jgi:hypothetical protein